MALTIALLGAATFDTNAGNKTVIATPTIGDLIVVIAPATGVATTVVADNQTPAGAYTKIGSSFTGFSTAGDLSAWVRTALITANASTTWTATQTSSTGGGLAVFRIAGASIAGLGAIRGAGGQSTGTGGTAPAPVLLGRVGTTFSGTQAALTTNGMITAIANGTSPGGTTIRSSPAYTRDVDAGYSVPATGLDAGHLNSGETASTITWGGNSASAFASIAIEIDASVPQYSWLGDSAAINRTLNDIQQMAVGRGATR